MWAIGMCIFDREDIRTVCKPRQYLMVIAEVSYYYNGYIQAV